MATRRIKAVFANYTDDDGVVQHANQYEEVDVSRDEEQRLEDAGALMSDRENEDYEAGNPAGSPAHQDQINEQEVKDDVELQQERERIHAEVEAEVQERAAEEIAKREEELAQKRDERDEQRTSRQGKRTGKTQEEPVEQVPGENQPEGRSRQSGKAKE